MKTRTRPIPHVQQWQCGFCGPGARGDPHVCHDSRGRCRGTWDFFVPHTLGNEYGAVTCACAASGHHKTVARVVNFAWLS